MNKLFMLLAVFFVSFTYGQNNKSTKYDNLITIQPTEVASSALLNLDFVKANTLKYTIVKNNDVLFTKEITKNEGAQMMKLDLSFLENGLYEVHFFIENMEIRKISLKKI